MSKISEKPRFVTLDIMRGFFILVIIADHLNRFPSWFGWITGQGRLWVSAGEGFFIISGLLVGYTRGYKKLNLSMRQVASLLYKRAFILYTCAVVTSAALLLLTLHSHFPLSLQPSVVVPKNSLSTAIYQIFTLHFVFEWVYFLKYYIASFLIAPLFIWLLRKKQAIVCLILAFVIWFVGYHIEQDWLQWQVLFFVPAVLGFHLEKVRSYWRTLSLAARRSVERGLMGITAFILLLSSFWVFGWELVKEPHIIMSFDNYVAARKVIDPLFYKVQLSLGRVLLAFICFAGLYIFFNKLQPRIGKYTDWLLLPFGKMSLVAYIIHGFIILPIQVFIPLSTSSVYNTSLGIVTVLFVYGVSQLKVVQKVVPR